MAVRISKGKIASSSRSGEETRTHRNKNSSRGSQSKSNSTHSSRTSSSKPESTRHQNDTVDNVDMMRFEQATRDGPKRTSKFEQSYVSAGDCISNGTISEKQEILSDIAEGKVIPCAEEVNEILTGLCRSRRMSEAHKLIDAIMNMPYSAQSQLLHNVKTFTIMIDICGKSNNLARAFALFYGMQREGMVPNAVTFNSIIAACARNNESELAFEVFKEMEAAKVEPDKFTFGALIDACAKRGNVDGAFELAELMESRKISKDQTIYSALMDACGRANLVDRAFLVFEDMKKSGVFPNLITFSLLIDTCADAREPEKAFQIFGEIKHWGYPNANVVVYTALINCCSKSGWPGRAKQVLETMIENGVEPNSITFGAYIDGWTRAGRLDEGFEALDDMIHKYNCEPNAVQLGGLVDTARRLREFNRAKPVWEVMVQFNVKVSRIFYPSLMAMAARNGDVDVAIGIAFYVLGTAFLRRCSLSSDEAFLRVLANAIIYVKHAIDSTKDKKLRRARQSRMAVFYESTSMTAEEMGSMDPEKAFFNAVSWGDNHSRQNHTRRRKEKSGTSAAKQARAEGLRTLSVLRDRRSDSPGK